MLLLLMLLVGLVGHEVVKRKRVVSWGGVVGADTKAALVTVDIVL